MAILTPDKTYELGNVKINEYLLTKHNPNKISMPQYTMKGQVIGVTVHNTDWINVASGTTPAEQYTRATVNGNMNSVRVHYYVDDKCAWQNLPLDLSGWHAADGNGMGNRNTIAIECIMSNKYNETDKKSEDNCARLAAALLHEYGFTIDNLYTHTHWLNVRDGIKGDNDYLNTRKHPYKWCPAYILPHWSDFKAKVKKYLDAYAAPTPQKENVEQPTTSTPTTSELYRIRKTWSDASSQIGAYSVLDNAKKACIEGYSVFDSKGNVVYTVKQQTFEIGAKVQLNGTLYSAATAKTGVKKTGTFYIYDAVLTNGRYRITTSKSYCNKKPMTYYVTGWANKSDLTII